LPSTTRKSPRSWRQKTRSHGRPSWAGPRSRPPLPAPDMTPPPHRLPMQ
jgi:hypothetical protein